MPEATIRRILPQMFENEQICIRCSAVLKFTRGWGVGEKIRGCLALEERTGLLARRGEAEAELQHNAFRWLPTPYWPIYELTAFFLSFFPLCDCFLPSFPPFPALQRKQESENGLQVFEIHTSQRSLTPYLVNSSATAVVELTLSRVVYCREENLIASSTGKVLLYFICTGVQQATFRFVTFAL